MRADPRLPRKTTPCLDPKPLKTFAWWTSAGCGAGITITRHRSDRPGGLGTDLYLRLAGQTAGRLGLVVYG